MVAVNSLTKIGRPRVTYRMVVGPDGFTETFDARTVEVLVRMGIIYLWSDEDNMGNRHMIYKTTGRMSMDVGGE